MDIYIHIYPYIYIDIYIFIYVCISSLEGNWDLIYGAGATSDLKFRVCRDGKWNNEDETPATRWSCYSWHISSFNFFWWPETLSFNLSRTRSLHGDPNKLWSNMCYSYSICNISISYIVLELVWSEYLFQESQIWNQLQVTEWLKQNLIKALTYFQNGKCEYLEIYYQQLSCVLIVQNYQFWEILYWTTKKHFFIFLWNFCFFFK